MPLRLAPKPLEIGPLDGFSKSDIFKAEATGERLANIVADIEGHSVIVFDGKWGTGKSVFVQQWAGLLRNRRHPVVYFDAFAHDHLDDAFFPLLGQFLRAHNKSGAPLQSKRDSLVAKARPLLRTVPAVLADIGLRAATGGMLTAEGIRDAAEQSEAADKGIAGVMIDECLAFVDKHNESIQRFRRALEQAVAQLERNDAISPLVFIIDELDRCRPNYALSVLERMKHLFAIDGVCFVLVTHLEELTAMVQHAYGLIDADAYLEKFYHRRFDFEKLLLRGSEELRKRYVDHLATGLEIDGDTELARTVIGNLVRIHSVSLRDQERIMLSLALFYAAQPMTQQNYYGYEMVPMLATMRQIDKGLFDLAASQDLKYADVSRFLRLAQWKGVDTEQVEHYWRLAAVDGFDGVKQEDKATRLSEWNLRSCRNAVAATCSILDRFGRVT